MRSVRQSGIDCIVSNHPSVRLSHTRSPHTCEAQDDTPSSVIPVWGQQARDGRHKVHASRVRHLQPHNFAMMLQTLFSGYQGEAYQVRYLQPQCFAGCLKQSHQRLSRRGLLCQAPAATQFCHANINQQLSKRPGTTPQTESSQCVGGEGPAQAQRTHLPCQAPVATKFCWMFQLRTLIVIIRAVCMW
jgi:hypothetical protein